MEDSDAIRSLIEARLTELGLADKVVSRKIGMNGGYLYDYFNKRSPKRMPDHVKVRLAQELRISPGQLGVTAVRVATSGFADDAEPYYAGGSSFPKMGPGQAPFIMRSTALSKHERGIRPGKVLVMNTNDVEPETIPVGKVVVASLYDRNELMKSHGTIIRQFLPPDKLVTNSSQDNEIIALDDPSLPYIAVIKGTLEYIIDDVRENGNRETHMPSN